MTLGVFYNQNAISNSMLNKAPARPGFNIAGDAELSLVQRFVHNFVQNPDQQTQLQRSTAQNIYQMARKPDSGGQNESQQAVDFAFQPAGKVKSFGYSPFQTAKTEGQEDELQKLLDEVDELVQKCYSGNEAAFRKLINLSKGTLSTINGMINNNSEMQEVYTKAKNAVYTLIDEAPNYPGMFQMMSQSGLLDEKEFGESANMAAKLINDAAYSTQSMQQLEQLLSSGTIKLEDYAKQAIEKDPNSAIETLVNLSQGNIRKDQKLTIVNLLSDEAENKPGSQSGEKAAKGLQKIIKTEGQNGILRAAFEGLTKSAIAGNQQSLKSLEELVKDPTISKNKAIQAVECLSKVASHGNSAGGEATKMLAGFTRDKRLAPQIREKAVDGLTQVAESGNANASMAGDALLDLAKLPQDPVGKKALANVTSMKNKDALNQGKLNEVLETAATSNKTDHPLKKMALNFLGDSGNMDFLQRLNSEGLNNTGNQSLKQNNNTNEYFVSPRPIKTNDIKLSFAEIAAFGGKNLYHNPMEYQNKDQHRLQQLA
jgi:hypothetical protein